MMENNEVKIYGTILFKRGTKADLESSTEIIESGEPVYEIDSKKLKIGDGEHVYSELPYISGTREQLEALQARLDTFLADATIEGQAVDTLLEIQNILNADTNLADIVANLNKIGEVPEGKTLMQLIENVEAGLYDDSALRAELSTKASQESLDSTNNNLSAEISRAQKAESKAFSDANAYTDTKVTDINNRIASTNGALSAEIQRATEAEVKALSDAKDYIDKVKTDILGEGITETFDTLVEIQDWINGDGVNATELTKAIADEAKLRDDEDTAIREEYKTADVALEESLKNYFDTELGVIANGSY